MGEGNDWHRLLIAPAVEKLLGVHPDERVLELACGNGKKLIGGFGQATIFVGDSVSSAR
jgi:hypothetical protein